MPLLNSADARSLPIQLYLVDTFTYSASALAAASVRISVFMNEYGLDELSRCFVPSLGSFSPCLEHRCIASSVMVAGTRCSQDSPLSLVSRSPCGFITTANVFEHAVR